MFEELFERVDEGFERSLETKKYLLACKGNPDALFLLDTDGEKIVWGKEVPHGVLDAAVGRDGVYVITETDGIYRMNGGDDEEVGGIMFANQLAVRNSGAVALRSSEYLADPSSGKEIRIDAPRIKRAEWIFSDGERDYLHYTTWDNEIVIAEVDLETGKVGKDVYRAMYGSGYVARQVEKVGDWLITAWEKNSLMAVKQLGNGWVLKGRFYTAQGSVGRFVGIEKGNWFEVYAVGYDGFVKIVTDREFRNVEVRDLWEKVGRPGYVLPLLALSAYEAGAYLGAEVE